MTAPGGMDQRPGEVVDLDPAPKNRNIYSIEAARSGDRIAGLVGAASDSPSGFRRAYPILDPGIRPNTEP